MTSRTRTALAVVCSAALAATAASAGEVSVERGRFRDVLLVTCEMEAIDAGEVKAPRPSRGRGMARSFTIADMAPEGSTVEAGQVVMRLDGRELMQRRLERQTELTETRGEIEIKQLEARARQAELRAKIAELEAKVTKATLDAEVDPTITSAIKLRDAQHELDSAEIELAKERRALNAAREQAKADVAILRIKEVTALEKLAEAERNLEAFVVTAPQAGIVVYYKDMFRDRKLDVGDVIDAGDPAMTIQDLTRMRVRCTLDQADRHRVREGLAVEVRLDAHPDTVFNGVVEEISAFAESPGQGWWRRSDVRIFELVAPLQSSDPNLVKPGLTARADILLRDEQGPMLPRRALTYQDGHFWAERADGERVEVELTARNAEHALIASGLEVGDIVVVSE